MKFQVDEISCWWNVKLLKCQVDEMSSWWDVKLMKCQVDEMSSWWNVKLMKHQVDETTSRLKLIKMSSSQSKVLHYLEVFGLICYVKFDCFLTCLKI